MPGLFKSIGNFFTGTPEKHKRVSTLRPEQEDLYNQLQSASQGPGAGGAFGDAADYYRNLLSDNPEDFNAFAAPEMRRFNEDIVPGLAEQFAGMGSGGLSSSGFRNSVTGAGADLSERLGALRAQLRQSGAAGLQNIGNAGLQNFSQDVVSQQGTPGLLGMAAPAIGNAISPLIQSGFSSLSNKVGNMFGGQGVGRNTSPYGGQPPQMGGQQSYSSLNVPFGRR